MARNQRGLFLPFTKGKSKCEGPKSYAMFVDVYAKKLLYLLKQTTKESERYPRKKVGDIYLDIRVTQCVPCKFPSPQAVQKLPPSALKVDANSSMLRAFFIHAQIFRLLLKISVEKAISRASHYFFLVSPFRWDNRQNVKLYKSLVKRRRQARAQRKSMQRYLMWRGINTNQWVFQINKSEWRPTSFSTTNENPWQ